MVVAVAHFQPPAINRNGFARAVWPRVALLNSIRHAREILTWKEFATVRPDLDTMGRSLIYEQDVGLGFLATTRPDGGPRLHPICPIVTDDGLYGFIVPGPRRARQVVCGL